MGFRKVLPYGQCQRQCSFPWLRAFVSDPGVRYLTSCLSSCSYRHNRLQRISKAGEATMRCNGCQGMEILDESGEEKIR